MTIDWTKIYEKYKGKWVALQMDEKTVIASADTPAEVLKKAEKKGYKSPIPHRVPTEVVPLIGGFQISNEVSVQRSRVKS